MTDRIKYFTRPFRVDNYKSHLKTYQEKWTEYQGLLNGEKQTFFDSTEENFIDTLDAHFEIEQNEFTFCFDADIVEKIVGDMFFDLDNKEECTSKERALSIFKKSPDADDLYTVKIKNMRQFWLIIKYVDWDCHSGMLLGSFKSPKKKQTLDTWAT